LTYSQAANDSPARSSLNPTPPWVQVWSSAFRLP